MLSTEPYYSFQLPIKASHADYEEGEEGKNVQHNLTLHKDLWELMLRWTLHGPQWCRWVAKQHSFILMLRIPCNTVVYLVWYFMLVHWREAMKSSVLSMKILGWA